MSANWPATPGTSAIGTDLDGGYGREQTPADLDTIADLARLPDLLSRRGYRHSDVTAIMHGNWIRFLFVECWGERDVAGFARIQSCARSLTLV